MKTVNQTITNERLKKTVSYHVVPDMFSISAQTKTITGQVLSFNSTQITDCMNDRGQVLPELMTQFTIENVAIENLNLGKTVSDFIDANLAKIVSA
ncbi:MAG: hypothetical protein JST26_04910 [Bacteroidetes bacterium]|nr:hypothetical protein [Bacteroidota bacterium]